MTDKNWRENFQELDRITALVPGKPEVVLFSFVCFLRYVSLECMAAILPGMPSMRRCVVRYFWPWMRPGVQLTYFNSVFGDFNLQRL